MRTSTQKNAVIHVVDDDESFQVAISRLLRAVGYDVRSYTNAGDFLLRHAAENRPSCMLLDVGMPGPSGLELQKALAERTDPPPIIFLSGRGDIPMSVKAMKAGALDFLTKPIERETLFGAIENALARAAESRISDDELRLLRARYSTLTLREMAVFEGAVAGKLNKEIGMALAVSVRTVKANRAQVMKKMGAATFAELVHIADRLQVH